jgi:hypothetical protein
MMPLLLILSLLFNLLLGVLTWILSKSVYPWANSWYVVPLGLIASCVVALFEGAWFVGRYGLARVATFGLALCLTLSLVIAFAHGVFLKTSLDLIVIGGAFGLAHGNALALALGKRSNDHMDWSQVACQVFYVILSLIALVFFSAYAAVVIEAGDVRALPPQYLAYGAVMAIGIILVFGLIYFRFLSHPVYAIVSLVTYLWAKSRPERAARIWLWNPVAWHEVIWMPVPFAGRLLSLVVENDREEGLAQIRFVQAERPHQRWAAKAALVQVIFKDLRSSDFDRIGSAAQRLAWTNDVRDGLPKEVVEAIPKLVHVSRQVEHSRELHSPYSRRGRIEGALKEVNDLQTNLTSKPGRLVPDLSTVVNEWERLIKSEHKRVAETVKGQGIIIPFVYGQPVGETDQNLFVGRKEIIRRLEGALIGSKHPPTLLLYGPRRMGKSSLLRQLPRVLGPDVVPALVDCQDPAVSESRQACLRRLSRAIADGLRRRAVLVDPISPDALRESPFDAYGQWLDSVERSMPEEMRILLCLDEYEQIQGIYSVDWVPQLLDHLRHTIQNRVSIRLMFTGSHTFEELGAHWNDRFPNAMYLRIGLLQWAEVEPLLTNPVSEFTMTYESGVQEMVFGATNGQPFLTQAVAYHLGEIVSEEDRLAATPADVERAIRLALRGAQGYFANVWSDAQESGRAVLLAACRGERLPESPKALDWLRNNDVFDYARGGFVVPMVERWVRSQIADGV